MYRHRAARLAWDALEAPSEGVRTGGVSRPVRATFKDAWGTLGRP
jgi:hypothetical protein